MSSALVRRVATVTPYASLLLLLTARALSVWGTDESLAGLLATHLPIAGYCAIALGALGASVFGRSLTASLAALPCLALALVPLGGWTTPSQAAAASSAQHRVLTWNVEQWSHGGTAVGRAIAEIEPDVLCLQEARSYASFPGDREWKAFEAALPGYRLLRYGEIAIGTRWPVIAQQRVDLHEELRRRPLLDVTLQTPDGGRVRVLNAHLVHTGYYGKRPSGLLTAARTRRTQVERILEHIGPDAQATILCGDLNAAPNSAVLARLRERLSDAWRLRGHGFGLTSTTRWPLLRIDYLLVSDIDVGEIRVLEQPLSDHRGLTATFALAPGALGATAARAGEP